MLRHADCHGLKAFLPNVSQNPPSPGVIPLNSCLHPRGQPQGHAVFFARSCTSSRNIATISLFPLLEHKAQPKWKYHLSCHFLGVTSWLIAKDGYKKIDKKHRIDFWIGIGIGTWTTAILMTMVGYLAADYLNKDMLIGLAIVNPVYFFCMMIGAMKNLSISVAVVLGTILGPLIYLVSTEWALLFAGLIGGTVAFLFGEKNGK